MKPFCTGLEIPALLMRLAEGKVGLNWVGGAFANGGGRGGSEEGGCGFEEAGLRPGGGGRDMMNGCPEEKIDAISDVPDDCR